MNNGGETCRHAEVGGAVGGGREGGGGGQVIPGDSGYFDYLKTVYRTIKLLFVFRISYQMSKFICPGLSELYFI